MDNILRETAQELFLACIDWGWNLLRLYKHKSKLDSKTRSPTHVKHDTVLMLQTKLLNEPKRATAHEMTDEQSA